MFSLYEYNPKVKKEYLVHISPSYCNFLIIIFRNKKNTEGQHHHHHHHNVVALSPSLMMNPGGLILYAILNAAK